MEKERYFVEQVLRLFSYASKVRDNRLKILSLRGANVFVDKVFSFLTHKGSDEKESMLTMLFTILEAIVMEGPAEAQQQEKSALTPSKEEVKQEVDREVEAPESTKAGGPPPLTKMPSSGEQEEALRQVLVFFDKIATSCEIMIENGEGLKWTSKQIIALSRILPFLAFGKQ